MSGTTGVSGSTPPNGESDTEATATEATETGTAGGAMAREGLVMGVDAEIAEEGDQLCHLLTGSLPNDDSSADGWGAWAGGRAGATTPGPFVISPVRCKDAAARRREDGTVGEDASPMRPTAPDSAGADDGDPLSHGGVIWPWF